LTGIEPCQGACLKSCKITTYSVFFCGHGKNSISNRIFSTQNEDFNAQFLSNFIADKGVI
jgi:hypothetical protein